MTLYSLFVLAPNETAFVGCVYICIGYDAVSVIDKNSWVNIKRHI